MIILVIVIIEHQVKEMRLYLGPWEPERVWSRGGTGPGLHVEEDSGGGGSAAWGAIKQPQRRWAGCRQASLGPAGRGPGPWPRRGPEWVLADGVLCVAERRQQPREQKC